MIPSVIKWNQDISKQAEMMVRPETKDVQCSPLCSSLPPAILNHSYTLTHIDQVGAERCEMECRGALYGMLRHLRRRSGLIAKLNSICHPLSCGFRILDISQWDAIMSNSIITDTETQSGKWSNHNPLLVKLHDCNFSRLWTPVRHFNESWHSSTQGQSPHKVTLHLMTQS